MIRLFYELLNELMSFELMEMLTMLINAWVDSFFYFHHIILLLLNWNDLLLLFNQFKKLIK